MRKPDPSDFYGGPPPEPYEKRGEVWKDEPRAPTLEELGEAINQAMTVFTTMTHKVMSGRVTWANLQGELTEDEQKMFLAFLNIGRKH